MATRIDAVRVGITNTFVLRGSGTVLVDAGGPFWARSVSPRLLALLGSPPRLDLILVTHAHFDHIGAAGPLREATGAPIAVHRADAGLLRDRAVVWPPGVTTWGKLTRRSLGPLATLLVGLPAIVPDIEVGDDGLDLAPYGVDGLVVHTPGHSPGSLSVVLPSGDALVGDVAMNAFPLTSRPSFGIYADRPEQVRESWRKLLDLGMHTAYPAHGRPFPATALAAKQISSG
jgi:hydroxyacylglutathione hydrolase